MNKRFVALAIVLIVGVVFFGSFISGCKAAPKQVTVSFWHLDVQDAQKAIWQKKADAFMALHPNVKIEITVLENEAFKQKIATVMQSGNPPDLFRSWGGGVMNAYAEAGLLKDITAETVGNPWGDSLAKGPLGIYSYKGKVYGAPFNMGGVGIWYNKALFEKAGVKAPFQTWTELLDGVKKLKKAGITPIALGGNDKWPGHFWWTYLAVRIGGKDAFDKAYSRTGSFADPAFVQAGEKLKELIDLEPYQKGFLAATYNDEGSLVGNGKAAMELMGQWAPGTQRANTTDGKGIGDNLGYMPFPAVEGGAGKITDVMGGGDGYIVGKNASQEAVEFLKFFMSPEQYPEIVEPLSILPVTLGSIDWVSDPNMKSVADMVSKAEYFQLYYDQYLPPAVGEAVKDATQALYAKTKTPAEAAQMIEAAMVAETPSK